jgi:hypothetical protein
VVEVGFLTLTFVLALVAFSLLSNSIMTQLPTPTRALLQAQAAVNRAPIPDPLRYRLAHYL